MAELTKSRLKSYSFWVSLASAILLLVQTVGRPLGLVIDEATYMSIVNSVLGVFVVLGIVTHPSQTLIKFSDNSKVETEEDKMAKIETKSNQNVVCGDDDTKSDCDGSKTLVDAAEDNTLSEKSKQKLENFKQELRNLYN